MAARTPVISMSESEQLAEYLQSIEAAAAGDHAARDRLLELASARLRTIARSMLRQFPNVSRWEQTDDIWQSASLRLWKALEDVQVESPRHFFNLAALQIRRELIELARRYSGPQGIGRHHATPQTSPASDDATTDVPADETHEASRLAAWTEMHEKVGALPEDEREVFELIWYQGLRQQEVAEVLETSVRTVKRRWQAARLRLHDQLQDSLPF